MKNLCPILLIIFDLGIGGIGAQASLQLEGKEKFVKKIEKALALLKEKSTKHYDFVDQYVDKIEQNEKTGAVLGQRKIIISEKSCPNLDWCAAVFVHEAVHFEQFHNGTYTRNTSLQNEIEANRVMRNVLADELNAKEYLVDHLDYLLNSGIDHSDLDGDGQYTIKDYELRDY